MVRIVTMIVALAVAAPSVAQDLGGGVDWRGAGGDLFGPPAKPLHDGVPEAQPASRLPELDQPFQTAIDAAAIAHGLDPKLLHALVITESAYRAGVCSPAGACGLTQLMPGTARDLQVEDRLDPVENLRGGADYLARQILRFGDLRLALAAFNAGPERVARLGRAPRIPETTQYVASVIECYLALSAGRGARTARQCRGSGDAQ